MVTYEDTGIVTGEGYLEQVLSPYKKAIEQRLKRLRAPESELSTVASAFLESGGKRVRSCIALLACEAVNRSYARAMPIALSYELAHAASLTQDDIIDRSPTRHSQPTVHSKHGVVTAILVSDVLIFKIFEQLARYEESSLSRKQLSYLVRYLAKSSQGAAAGEYMEMQLSKVPEVTIDDYVQVARLKTGSLFGGAAASGAVAGGAPPRVIRDFYDFGINLGIAFQMVDDVLDMTGASAEMGKPMMKDLQNDATNIVMVHALSVAGAEGKNRLRSAMRKSAYGLTDVMDVLSYLDDLGSVVYAEQLSKKYADLAKSKLKGLAPTKAKKTLEELTRWVEVRRR